MTVRDLSSHPERSPADRLIDDVVPETVDWEAIVRRHPLPSLAVAALVGYLVGRTHGPDIATAVADGASRRIEAGVDRFIGQLAPAFDDDADGDDGRA